MRAGVRLQGSWWLWRSRSLREKADTIGTVVVPMITGLLPHEVERLLNWCVAAPLLVIKCCYVARRWVVRRRIARESTPPLPPGVEPVTARTRPSPRAVRGWSDAT